MYLHEQGVIHRDIKGANILTTKDGEVKLADFGVATKRGASESTTDDPAGSPYWMAPEIIEMNGATPKSDIWSVGCTIVELATGQPPYFELDTMPALFRIVQDDCPPIPDGLSPLLNDFLLKCFQKEPFLRASAEQLLKHRWIQIYDQKSEKINVPPSAPQVVKDYNEKLKEKIHNRPKPAKPRSKKTLRKAKKKLENWDDLEIKVNRPEKSANDDDDNWDKDFEIPSKSKLKNKEAIFDDDIDWDKDFDDSPKLEIKKVENNDDDNWDDDFEGDIDLNKKDPPSNTEIKDDDWDDLELDDKKKSSEEDEASHLQSILAKKLNTAWDTNENSAVDDPFDMFDDELFDEEYNLEETLYRDKIAKITSDAVRAIELFSTTTSEEAILNSCKTLSSIFSEYSNEMPNIFRRTGVIPFIEMLQTPNNKVILAGLKLVNQIVQNSKIRESFCILGGIPTTLQYASRKYSYPIRLEASVFLKQMISARMQTMNYFIAAGGLPVLVEFIMIEEDFSQNKELFLIGIECIHSILTSDFSVKIPKNDFCRIFAKANLLPNLARALQLVNGDAAIKFDYSEKIADLLLTFSKGDQAVKEKFSEHEVLKKLFVILSDSSLPPSIYLKILKCINILSMWPSTLDSLQQSGAIKVLVNLLERKDGELAMESLQQLYSALYNICRIDGNRQLLAAKAGIIPHLQWAIRENHPLKQFALPLIYEMSRTKRTRAELWKHDGINFFLSLFQQQYPWQVQAVDSLSSWLLDEPKKVSAIIENNIDKFVNVLTSANDDTLLQLLEPLHKMISHSKSVNRAMGKSNFIEEIIKRLNHHNALVRVNLLKILKALFIHHQKPSSVISKYQLKSVVKQLEKDEKVLVAEMARELSKLFSSSKSSTKLSKKEEKKRTSKKKM